MFFSGIVSKISGGAYMRKNKIIILLSVLVLVISLTGCGLGNKSSDSSLIKETNKDVAEKSEKAPIEMLKNAQTNLYELSAVKQKVKTENSGNVEGIENVEAIVIYEFDTNKGYVEMETDGELVAILIENDKLYVKDGKSDKYVDFSDSILGKVLLSAVNSAAINENYKELDDKMLNLIKPENITVENAEITINGKNEKVKKISATISYEEADKVLSEYMKSMIENTMNSMLDELTEFQVTMLEGTGETLSEDEKKNIRETLTAEINKQIEEQLKGMKFSDIKIVYYIKDGIALKQESFYSITANGETSNIKTTSEILEYGDNVRCPEISKEDIVSFDEYLNK